MRNSGSYLVILMCTLSLILFSCQSTTQKPTSSFSTEISGPYFANGVHNGWADQSSIVIWTRLTKHPEAYMKGQQFMDITKKQHKRYRKLITIDSLVATQLPEGLTLDDMIGATPGMSGFVQLSYFPAENKAEKMSIDWRQVNDAADFTTQWELKNLQAGTKYMLELRASAMPDGEVTDELFGSFFTAPQSDELAEIDFVVTTCHDFIRKDDGDKGHKIYPAMSKLDPDFYVHAGDIEYYDKPLPYAFTKEMMRFKWNRLFALPNQREFWNQHTSYFMKDDHDVLADDAFEGMTYGQVSWEEGLQIFDKEQFPRFDQRYKTIRWGRDLQLWIMEGRNFRSKNTDPDGPDKTIWGHQQKEWFFKTVSESDATFKILLNSTPILGPDRDSKMDNYSNINFTHEGKEIRDFINQYDNLFIVNGDRHWQFVTHFENTNLWEFSCGAGSDEHAGGWKQEDKRPQHKFLRVAGGFLSGHVSSDEDVVTLRFKHHDVNGTIVNEEIFEKKLNGNN